MTDALDWIASNEPEHAESFTRLRAAEISDPYNPDAVVEDWTEPSELPLRGAWSSASSAYGTDPVREQLTTTKQIAIFDAAADVREGSS
ncbi:MAG TPA: hypothetical protein VIP82_20755 [Microbacterium sp.]|uniref:hypothetical protein n=1 Tax=Microbacterium sp. TaxID=51671 RepID=UPI002F924D29